MVELIESSWNTVLSRDRAIGVCGTIYLGKAGRYKSVGMYKSAFTASVFGLLLFPVVASASFADVNANTPHGDAISYLEKQQILSGYADKTFRPNKTINRAELLKIIVKGALKIDPSTPDGNCFPDVHADQWYAAYVCYALDEGWVKGYEDGTFQPAKTLTQPEALKMIVTGLGHASSNTGKNCPGDAWYSPYLCKARDLDILDGADFDVEGPMSRSLAAAWLSNAIQQVRDTALPPQENSSNSSYMSSSTAASSMPSLVNDTTLNLSIQSFLANSEENLSAMKETADTYSAETLKELRKKILDGITEYQRANAQLTFLGKITETRSLTPEEAKSVGSLKTRMNCIIGIFNRTYNWFNGGKNESVSSCL